MKFLDSIVHESRIRPGDLSSYSIMPNVKSVISGESPPTNGNNFGHANRQANPSQYSTEGVYPLSNKLAGQEPLLKPDVLLSRERTRRNEQVEAIQKSSDEGSRLTDKSSELLNSIKSNSKPLHKKSFAENEAHDLTPFKKVSKAAVINKKKPETDVNDESNNLSGIAKAQQDSQMQAGEKVTPDVTTRHKQKKKPKEDLAEFSPMKTEVRGQQRLVEPEPQILVDKRSSIKADKPPQEQTEVRIGQINVTVLAPPVENTAQTPPQAEPFGFRRT